MDYKNKYLKYKYKYFSLFGGSTNLGIDEQLVAQNTQAPETRVPSIEQKLILWNKVLEIYNNLKKKIIIEYNIKIELNTAIYYSSKNITSDTKLEGTIFDFVINYNSITFINKNDDIGIIHLDSKDYNFFIKKKDNTYLQFPIYIINGIMTDNGNKTKITQLRYLYYFENKKIYENYTNINNLSITETINCYSLSLINLKGYKIVDDKFIMCIQKYIQDKCNIRPYKLGVGAYGANCIYLNNNIGIKYNMNYKTNLNFNNEIFILITIKKKMLNGGSLQIVANNILSIRNYYYFTNNRDTYNFFLYDYYPDYSDLSKYYDSDNTCLLLVNQKEYIIKTLLYVIKKIHNINIKHRDIKLENIIYNLNTNNMILIDFGIATDRSSSYYIVGTQTYIDYYRYDKPFINNILKLHDYWSIGILIWKLYIKKNHEPFNIFGNSKNYYSDKYRHNILNYYNFINFIITNNITNETSQILEININNYDIKTIENTINQIKDISIKINQIPNITNLLSNTNFGYDGDLSFWNFFAKEIKK